MDHVAESVLILLWLPPMGLRPKPQQAEQALLQSLIHFSWETLKSIMQCVHIQYPRQASDRHNTDSKGNVTLSRLLLHQEVHRQ